MKKSIRFYIALWLAKLGGSFLKLLGRNASYFPGKFAVTICPDFLGRIDKPEIIIGVTGTNGKTTVSNMIEDILKENDYDFIDNHLGSNVNSGIATTFINGSTFLGKAKKKMAVLEIDERSAKLVYPYLQPTYLVCTNLFRDSMKRNAHTEFISNILSQNIPQQTTLILNGDDLICSSLAPNNPHRVYFGIDRLESDTEESKNIVKDMIVCPKCSTKLVYEYYRYNHMGKAHCPNCDFASPAIDYLAKNLDLENKTMQLAQEGKTVQYPLISDNIINIYNMLAAISVLKQLGLSDEKLIQSLKNLTIVESRYSEEIVRGKKIVAQLAKGQNPIACSRAMSYVASQPGKKAVILLLDDLHDAANSSETIAWYYDTDYEFLNQDDIVQILVGGARYLDQKVRLDMASVPAEKITCTREELEAVSYLDPTKVDAVYILYDLYSMDLRKQVEQRVQEIIEEKIPEEQEGKLDEN